jgi:hypothetical protein
MYGPRLLEGAVRTSQIHVSRVQSPFCLDAFHVFHNHLTRFIMPMMLVRVVRLPGGCNYILSSFSIVHESSLLGQALEPVPTFSLVEVLFHDE